MTVHDHSTSVFERLTRTFGEWLNHRRELNEMSQLSPAEFNRIASDLEISPADLNELVNKGPHAADELPKLLAALGIDAKNLARIEPVVLHDMERVCSLCGEKHACDRDLAAGTSAGHYQQYCPNASTIAALRSPAGN
jgi:transcriptional regulator with XRE-family HTH domain